MIYFSFFNYYADMKNCKSFRGFGFIYYARVMHGLIKNYG